MNNDEFAFLNQQLAAMVRDGIPLETALRRLCADMRHGALRGELEKLESALATGVPLTEAVRQRQLPDLYKRMLVVGAKSNDLPGVLTMLADHYQRRQVMATRLKGLMVYPAIVLVAALALSIVVALLLGRFVFTSEILSANFGRANSPANFLIGLSAPPVILGLAVAAFAFALGVPSARRALRWRLPAFKEASLAETASALALMLKSGVPLDDALALVQELERGSPADAELARWRKFLAAGNGKFPEMASGGRIFPPLFIWIVSQAREDLGAGFQRAAEMFRARANYRSELLLYSALPCSVLALGAMIVMQYQPVMGAFISFMNLMSNVGGVGN